MKRKLSLILFSLMFSSCHLSHPYQRPIIDLPKALPDFSMVEHTPLQVCWWKSFEDPDLVRLIEEALVTNYDLKCAAIRIAEAKAYLGIKKIDQLPSLSAQISAKRSQLGQDTTQPKMPRRTNYFDLSAILNFEIDLWKRLANMTQSAQNQLLASQKLEEAARLSIACEVALTYFHLLEIDERIILTKRLVTNSQEVVFHLERQKAAEKIPLWRLQQAEVELLHLQAQLPQLYQKRTEIEGGLSVLLGRTPKEIVESKISRSLFDHSRSMLLSISHVSSNCFIEHRADIVAAELQLQAAHADVNVVRAAYLPQLSLTAMLGFSTSQIERLFNSSNQQGRVGGNVHIPIYQFGRNKIETKMAKIQRQRAEENYRKSLCLAFKEIKGAMSLQSNSQQILELQTGCFAQQKAMLETLQHCYQEDYVDRLELLGCETALINCEIELTAAKHQLLAAIIILYKSLGGQLDS